MTYVLVGFGLGIAFMFLLRKLESLHNKKFKAGDENVCSECKFKNIVFESIEEVEVDN